MCLAEQFFNPRTQARLRPLYGKTLLKKLRASRACCGRRRAQTLGCEPGELRGLLKIDVAGRECVGNIRGELKQRKITAR